MVRKNNSPAADTGWPLYKAERTDFFHRTRCFPSEVADWRKDAVDFVKKHGELFPGANGFVNDAELRELLDEGIVFIREVTRILAAAGGACTGKLPATRKDMDAGAARVLRRLNPYRELGLDTMGMQRRKIGSLMKQLVPPPLSGFLAQGMEAHAASSCSGRNPQCNECSIRNFCGKWRQEKSSTENGGNAPRVADLFCGAGGLSEGFTRAGCRMVLSLDFDKVAMKTYRFNHPWVPSDMAMCRDVTDLEPGELADRIGKGGIDILAGAPPCQGFSSAGFRCKRKATGYKVTEDGRNYLFEYLVQAAKELKPELFLMENVPGMNSAKKSDKTFIASAARMLEEEAGYRTAIWRLNASAFGVPQNRIRYFLVASRSGLMPARPHEEYQDTARQDFDIDALPPITLEEAIFDLPPRKAGTGEAVDRKKTAKAVDDKRTRRYLKKFRILRDSPVLYNHTVRPNNKRDLELYALLKPGENSMHALERYDRPDLMRYRGDVFDDKYARLRGDMPSKTIVAHLAKDGNGYIHPGQTRSISVREAARAQSFHDEYAFCGSPSDQWTQLGNAVPPVLAEAVARSFTRTLSRIKGRK